MAKLVTLVNPNLVQPGITPYALDILTTSLEQNGFDVHVVDLTFQRERWRSVLRKYFATHEPLLVAFTIRNTDTIYPQEQRVFLESHLEIINLVKRLTDAPLIAGGVGFSSMPFALLDYFGLDYGVKGPGEIILANLANQLHRGESPEQIPGLLIRNGADIHQVPGTYNLWGQNPLSQEDRFLTVNQTTPYRRRSSTPYKVDNLQYYQNGGLGNFIAKNGCAFGCTHCVEPDAKGVLFFKRQAEAVVDELELLAAQGVHDVHSTDSEFNLAFANAKNILRRIIARKEANADSPLHDLRLWLYCQPAPFDEEFADLLTAAGCQGINFGSDHTVQHMLESWKVSQNGNFYTFEDVKRAHDLAQERGLLTMHDILLGMPGETIDTIFQCLDDTLGLNATTVGYTLGIRIFPYSPLGLRFAAESQGKREISGLQSNTAVSPILLKPMDTCANLVEYERQFMFDQFGRLRPLYYFSPELPEPPEVLTQPNGRWLNTLRLMREYIPSEDQARVMLPTAPGLTEDDNNYADNPFLMCLVRLGYKGAYWARWRDRHEIMQEAVNQGLAEVRQYKEMVFAPVFALAEPEA